MRQSPNVEPRKAHYMAHGGKATPIFLDRPWERRQPDQRKGQGINPNLAVAEILDNPPVKRLSLPESGIAGLSLASTTPNLQAELMTVGY
jgi:hypothetical protein